MIRGAFYFDTTPDGELLNTASNVEALRRLWRDPFLIDPADLGPGNRGDFDNGAWHVACHVSGAGGVRRTADGTLMWLEISHRGAIDEYWATAMSFPLVWDSDVKEWIKDGTRNRLIRMLNLKPKQKVPHLGDGHIVESLR